MVSWGRLKIQPERGIFSLKVEETVCNGLLSLVVSQNKKPRTGTSLVIQWLRLHLPMQGMWVGSLVRELRSHMPWGQNLNIEQKPYCKTLVKTLSSPHPKKKNLKKKKGSMGHKDQKISLIKCHVTYVHKWSSTSYLHLGISICKCNGESQITSIGLPRLEVL